MIMHHLLYGKFLNKWAKERSYYGIILAVLSLWIVIVISSALNEGITIEKIKKPFSAYAQTTTLSDFNFGAVGDWGCNSNTNSTVRSMVDRGIELNLALGDYSYVDTADCWFNAISPIDTQTKITIGNHDNTPSSLLNQYMSHFGLTKQFYSFNYQNVHFTVMADELQYTPGSEQYNFVNNDLSQAAADPNIDWIVVYFHKPLYTSPTCSCIGENIRLRDIYHSVFDKYGVDLVLEGHSHNYQRSYPLKYNPSNSSNPIITDTNKNNYNDPEGEIFAIVGTGGINFHGLTGQASYVVTQHASSFGFLNVDVINNGTTFSAKFYANDGTIKDQFTITKSTTTPPPPPPPPPTTQKYNYAPYVTLSGSNYTQVSSNTSLQLTTFSVASWFKTSTDFASNAFIVNKGGIGSESSGQNMNYGIFMGSNERIYAGFEIRTGPDHFIISPNTYNDGQWHYAVATYDGTTSALRLYIDGVQVASKSTAGAIPDNTGTQPVRIGANSLSLNQYFTGNADEVRVWNRELTAQEVSDQYNNGIFNTNGQVLYLNFGTSNTATNEPPTADAGPDQTVPVSYEVNMRTPTDPTTTMRNVLKLLHAKT
jgi:hypothetical protein